MSIKANYTNIKAVPSLITGVARADLRDYFSMTRDKLLFADLISDSGLTVELSSWDFTIVVWYVMKMSEHARCTCYYLDGFMDEVEYVINKSDQHWELRCSMCKSLELLNSLHVAIIGRGSLPKSIMSQAIKQLNPGLSPQRGPINRLLNVLESSTLDSIRVSWEC